MERCLKRNLPLAPRDLLILSGLAEGPAHGYGIIRWVRAHSEQEVDLDPANLYRALRRMTQIGWVEEVPPEQDAPRPGRQRRFVALTPMGRRVLRWELRRLERLVAATMPTLGTLCEEA